MVNNFAAMMAAKRAAAEGRVPQGNATQEQILEGMKAPMVAPTPAAPLKINAFSAKLGAKPMTSLNQVTAPVTKAWLKGQVEAKSAATTRTPPAYLTVDDDLGMSLDSLLDSEDEGIAPDDEPDYETREVLSQFDDETPASRPTRELPEDADKNLRQFVETIDGIYDILHEPELLGNCIRGIMVELQANKQYMQQVADEDIRVWVKAMRSTMGLAKIRKTEAKAKRAGGGKAKGKGMDADMESAFGELGIDFDNL